MKKLRAFLLLTLALAAAARAVTAGPDRAFMLYRRTAGEDFADRAHLALIGAARHSIDLMQSDFSPGLDCWFGYLNPDPCTLDRLPVYFPALLSAMDEERVLAHAGRAVDALSEAVAGSRAG